MGKWTQKTCRLMIDKLYRRVELPFPNQRIQFFSDGNDDYEYVLPEFYAETCMDYAQLVKIRENGRVVDLKKRVVYGSPNVEDIILTDVENFNGILRERIGRLVRKTKCYPKSKTMLSNAVEVIQFYWNFMNPLYDSMTPGMIESLTDHVWSWDDFLTHHYAV